MPDLEPIKGLIELQDDFTSELGLAEAALGNFTKQNQESLTAVAGAVGIVVGAIGALTVATIELGKRGSDVNDLTATLEHFAGGAQEAEDIMAALRKGTLDTVDDFALAKDAAHLLSAGVKLTAEDFGTLGEAAFVLQNRGLGGTKEQLDLVSDALVTGRTRALSMALGVIDAGDAEEKYAKSLGITKDQLSDAGKAEAHRIEVMDILRRAVADAGEQQRDFGEEFEYVEAQISNFVDDLGSAVASSKVFQAGIQGLEAAVASAFSGKQDEAIKTVIGLLEDGATMLVGFAQTTVSAIKIAEGAWNAVRTVILGVETVITMIADETVGYIQTVATAANALNLISDETLQSVKDLKTNLEGMKESFQEQTAEAARGILGHTAFDDTLDKLSATLGNVKAAMLGAAGSTEVNTEANKVAESNAKKLAATQEELNKKMIDGTKVAAALEKSTNELAGIWAEYNKIVVANSGTSRDAQIADIEATFQKNIASLDSTDKLYKEKYAAFQAVAKASLDAISSDWGSVRDKSIEALRQQLEVAENTYRQMTTGSNTFSRQTLEEQRKKIRDLQDEIRGVGRATADAVDDATSSIKLLDHAWVTDADIAEQTLNKTTVMVKTLSGEVISLMEAQRRQQAGFSYNVDPIDQFTIDRTPGGADALLKQLAALAQSLPQMKANIRSAEDQNKYFEALAKYNALRDAYNLLISQSKSKGQATGFAEGGTVMVGEKGPEIVRLPIGATVYPTGMQPLGGKLGGPQVNITNNWTVNGTGAQVAREVSQIIMNQLKNTRQFGAA